MKKNLFAIVAVTLAMFSCSDQQLMDDMQDQLQPLVQVNDIEALKERVKWGDGQACLELADRYRTGNGVKKDFIGMLNMVALADDFGSISSMETYLDTLPEKNGFKLVIEAVDKYEKGQTEEALAMAEELDMQGMPDFYSVLGIFAVERGDTLEGQRLIEMGAERGSSFAELLLCIPNWRDCSSPDIPRLTALADRIPFVYTILADAYRGRYGKDVVNAELAAHYYLKADENATLGKRGARWLLHYHEDGGQLPLSDVDIQRLRKLADWEPVEEPEPTTYNDEVLEDAVSQVLQDKMTECACEFGAVYVVETSTGHLVADVSLLRNGSSFVPCKDTYSEEQPLMLGAPVYLALLSTGQFSPDDTIDTEYGVYKDVRDHNWHRGGYGVISLEQALGHSSQVAFTKAREMAFGNRQNEFYDRISTYLSGDPNYVMGVLAFYNAVANGGKMVQLTKKGYGVTVLDEQIAAPEHIETLQKGLCNAVTKGLFRRVDRDYTDVAACGRTFQIADSSGRRMELYGYFPADSPLYTIMVTLEKDGLPASAGAMCGPVMTSTIDLLADSYGLRSVVAHDRNTASVEEPNGTMVDTIAIQ